MPQRSPACCRHRLSRHSREPGSPQLRRRPGLHAGSRPIPIPDCLRFDARRWCGRASGRSPGSMRMVRAGGQTGFDRATLAGIGAFADARLYSRQEGAPQEAPNRRRSVGSRIETAFDPAPRSRPISHHFDRRGPARIRRPERKCALHNEVAGCEALRQRPPGAFRLRSRKILKGVANPPDRLARSLYSLKCPDAAWSRPD